MKKRRSGSGSAEATAVQQLRRMSADEAQATYHAAKLKKKLYAPMHLFDAWRRWNNSDLRAFADSLRELINDPVLTDDSLLAGHLARFVELMVVRFERLVDKGAFDSALPRLTALPLLYSPNAGKGAREWQRAFAWYMEKGVGTKALMAYRGRDPKTARNPLWGELAEVAVRVVHQAATELSTGYYPSKEEAIAMHVFVNKRSGAKKTVRVTLYRLAEGGALLWPDWLDHCAKLPERVSDGVAAYSAAVAAVLEEFFADPNNQFADEILRPMLRSNYYTRPQAVNEARKAILGCVARFSQG